MRENKLGVGMQRSRDEIMAAKVAETEYIQNHPEEWPPYLQDYRERLDKYSWTRRMNWRSLLPTLVVILCLVMIDFERTGGSMNYVAFSLILLVPMWYAVSRTIDWCASMESSQLSRRIRFYQANSMFDSGELEQGLENGNLSEEEYQMLVKIVGASVGVVSFTKFDPDAVEYGIPAEALEKGGILKKVQPGEVVLASDPTVTTLEDR